MVSRTTTHICYQEGRPPEYEVYLVGIRHEENYRGKINVPVIARGWVWSQYM
jgi:hypothetical protein